MRNTVLKLMVAVSITGYINLPCLAGSTESSNESAVPLHVGGAGVGPQINQAIQASSKLSPEAKQVNVTTKDDAVVITGTVPTDGDKQKINSIAEQSGATNIRNEVKVAASTTKKKVASKAKTIYIKH